MGRFASAPLRLYRLVSRAIPARRLKAEGRYLVHCSSVGEATAAVPLLRALGPGAVLSVFTQSGYRRALDMALGKFPVIRFPGDSPKATRELVKGKELLILVEGELWPNLLAAAGETGVRVALVDGRLGRSLGWWRRLKGAFLELISLIHVIFPKDKRSRAAFVSLGVPEDKLGPVGSLKYDALARPRRGITPHELGLEPPVVVLASLRPQELRAAAEAAARLAGKTSVVLAPRYPRLGPKLAKMLSGLGLAPKLRSRGQLGSPLILDTLGELWDIYSFSDAAFVGGTLAPVGGHNVLEPAYWGVPVVVGPHVYNIEDDVELLAGAGGLVVIEEPRDLSEALLSLVEDPRRDERSERLMKAVKGKMGVSKRILDYLKSL